jgi:hypothetical protein
MNGRQTKLSESDECFCLLVESLDEYAILPRHSKGHLLS